ncbi:MAG: hypothetical protein DID90_2727553254 [Candidatus Nitrotoga sp. LAW]|nr:MAG: hypothetical protein DID90_2727553254 [Candidatus Nitrotoga sp. LAW]
MAKLASSLLVQCDITNTNITMLDIRTECSLLKIINFPEKK